MVTFNTAQGEQKRFIEANPQFKSITVYDENQRRIRQSEQQGNTQQTSETIKNEASQKQQQTAGDADDGERKGRKKGVKM
jgi:hypothetical protein